MKIVSRIAIIASLFFTILAPTHVEAAVDMFLKIVGIPGESNDKPHKDQIDVLAWSWGMTQSGTTHAGGGGGAGKANFQDLSVTKYIDKSSPKLMAAISTGDLLPSAVLVVRKAGGTGLEYITITMEDVLITSLSTGGSGGEDRLTENITLNFARVTVDYIPQNDDGSTQTTETFGYNIPANMPL